MSHLPILNLPSQIKIVMFILQGFQARSVFLRERWEEEEEKRKDGGKEKTVRAR